MDGNKLLKALSGKERLKVAAALLDDILRNEAVRCGPEFIRSIGEAAILQKQDGEVNVDVELHTETPNQDL